MEKLYTLPFIFITSFIFVSILKGQDPLSQTRLFFENMQNQRRDEIIRDRERFLAENNMRTCIFTHMPISAITIAKLSPINATEAVNHNFKILEAVRKNT